MTSILICTDLRTRLSHQCCLILGSPDSLCSGVVTYCLQLTSGTVPVLFITAGSLYILSMCYIMFLKVQCECYYVESRYTNLYAITLLILRWNSNLYNLLRQPGAGLLKITQTRTKLKVCVTNYITILLLMHCGYICSHLV